MYWARGRVYSYTTTFAPQGDLFARWPDLRVLRLLGATKAEVSLSLHGDVHLLAVTQEAVAAISHKAEVTAQ